MSIQSYIPVWLFLLGILVPLTYKYTNKISQRFETLVSAIDEHNANQGLDWSSDSREIALDYLIPYRNKCISDYLSKYDISKREYIESLSTQVSKPYLLILSYLLNWITLFCGILAVGIYTQYGLQAIPEYLLYLFILTVVDIFLYVIN